MQATFFKDTASAPQERRLPHRNLRAIRPTGDRQELAAQLLNAAKKHQGVFESNAREVLATLDVGRWSYPQPQGRQPPPETLNAGRCIGNGSPHPGAAARFSYDTAQLKARRCGASA